MLVYKTFTDTFVKQVPLCCSTNTICSNDDDLMKLPGTMSVTSSKRWNRSLNVY